MARDLIGKYLVRQLGDEQIAARIHETEAYVGPQDLACHAAKGCTPRTEVMFGPAGRWYVYFIYGLHWMLNVVTESEGFPAAVLLRGAGPWEGPARLTKALGIDKRLNGWPAEESSRPVDRRPRTAGGPLGGAPHAANRRRLCRPLGREALSVCAPRAAGGGPRALGRDDQVPLDHHPPHSFWSGLPFCKVLLGRRLSGRLPAS